MTEVQSTEDYARDVQVKREAIEQAALVKRVIEIVHSYPRQSPKLDHTFVPFGNTKVYPGCVRCRWPQAAHPSQVPESKWVPIAAEQ
jgi:hypothetical protein